MKKLCTRCMTLGLCAVLCMALAACGETNPAANASSSPTATISAAPVRDTAPSQTPEQKTEPSDAPAQETSANNSSAGSGETLESYFAQNPDVMQQIKKSLEKTGMNIEVSAQGNRLIYNYRYEMDLGDVELVKETLEAYLDGSEATFNSLLSSMQEVVPSTESLVVNYLDQDGSLIAGREYDGTGSASSGGFNFDASMGAFDSLESFIAENRDMLDEVIATMATDEIDVSITAEGTILVYDFQFQGDLTPHGDMSDLKAKLEEGIDTTESIFTGLLDMMKSVVPDITAIQVNYLDRNGSVITSREFR